MSYEETQYNNVMNIITEYPNRPANALNNADFTEQNIMSVLFSNTFIPSNMKSSLLKYLQTDVYSSMENKVKYFDIDMGLITGIPNKNSEIVDIDVSYYNKPTIVKYYFLLDTISEIYAYLLKNNPRNFVTIRSRYVMKDGDIKLKEDGIYTFAINYKYTENEGITHISVSNVTNGVSETAVSEMCDLFIHDIIKHLNYINKVDVSGRNQRYLTNLMAFYKFCRLKLVYYTLLSAIEVSENVSRSLSSNLSYTFLNLKNHILINNSENKNIILTNRLLSTRKKLDHVNSQMNLNKEKIKRNKKVSEMLKDNYLTQIMYGILAIAMVFVVFAFIIKSLNTETKSGDYLGILIILIAIMIYVATYYIVQFNYVEHVEHFSVIKKFPVTAATSDFYKETTENVKIRIKPSSELSVKTAGWKVFDNNTDTYWESDTDTFEKPKRKFVKKVCTNVVSSSTHRYSVCTDPNPWVCGEKKVVQKHFSSNRTSCSTVIISKNLNESQPGNQSHTNNDNRYSGPTWSPITEKFIDKYAMSSSNTRTTVTTTYQEVPGQDLTHSFAKGGQTNSAQYLIFDLGIPIVLSYYKIKFVDKLTAPKTYRLIGTNDSKLLDTDEIFGTWHSTLDTVDVDPNSAEFNSLSLMRTNVNKSQEPVIDYSGKFPETIGKIENKNLSKVFEITENTYLDFLDDIEVDILLVGGGGSGGTRNGGGGGAGACIYQKKKKIPKGRYAIIIGEGGAYVQPGPGKHGNNGENTSMININTGEAFMIAEGGGGGGGGMEGDGVVGLSGASSGGSTIAYLKDTEQTHISPVLKDENLPSGKYGNEGGYGNYGKYNKYNNPGAGGGGGGAGGVGTNSIITSSAGGSMVEVGNGGPGIEIDITGSKKYYAAGGGGGTSNTNVNKVVGGTGGSGIGGDGSTGSFKDFARVDAFYTLGSFSDEVYSPKIYGDRRQISLTSHKQSSNIINLDKDIKLYRYEFDWDNSKYNKPSERDSSNGAFANTQKTGTPKGTIFSEYKRDSITLSFNNLKLKIGNEWDSNVKIVFSYKGEHTIENIETFMNTKNEYIFKEVYDYLNTDTTQYGNIVHVNNYTPFATQTNKNILAQNYKNNTHYIKYFNSNLSGYASTLIRNYMPGVQTYFANMKIHKYILKDAVEMENSDSPMNGKPNTGSGGGGGGTLRDETTTANEKNANDAVHNSASGAGGSGVVVIRYKQIFAKEYLKAFDEYRYYALVVDKLTGLGTSVKISELEFYKVPKTSQINSSTDFYSELLSPEIEIVGEAKEAVDAANKAYEDQKKLETDNAKKIQDLKDLLAGLGEDDLDWSAIDKNKSDREELLKLISQYETKMITEATNKAAYEAHLASQKLISAEIRLEEAQLQTHIDALNSIKTRIQQLQDEIGGAENTRRLEEQEAELLKTKTKNEAANAELEQAKIKEQADKLLLLKEQKISKDLANELAIVKSQLSDAQKELDNALYVKNNIRNIMDVVSQTEQELVAERIARATADVRKLNQITMTEEARIRAEAQLRIEQERKQHLIDRENDFTLLTNQSEANQAKIQLLNDKISDINEYLLDPSGYTSRYLEKSSVEFAQLELEKLQLDLEISEIRSKIDDFISKMGENARLTNEYRRQNVNIQKELDNQVQENIGWKLKTDNYKFAAENALSVEKSIYDVQTKISFNMESTMTTIANSIIVTAYDKELYDFSDRNEKSKLLSIKSVDDVNEQKRNNKISKATIKLVLNVFILSVALVMLHLNFSIFNMMSIIIIVYVIIFALYAIEVASIVHTRTDQKYWKKPDIAQLK